jgi:hypothetical protein
MNQAFPNYRKPERQITSIEFEALTDRVSQLEKLLQEKHAGRPKKEKAGDDAE